MTELLYYRDTDINTFHAAVESAAQTEKGLQLALDQTAFYPEGGGQPADRGTINGISVSDVQKKDGTVYHYLEPNSDEVRFSAGDRVEGIIDRAHRLDYMQQHSGQHIISAAMMKTAGVATVSVRQGADYTAVETDSAELSTEQMLDIEAAANSYIRLNVPIKAAVTDKEGLESYSLRRPTKHLSNIRIINIPGIDCVACGGMHLKSTAEIGLVKYIYQEKIRGHVRTFWKIGERAYRDYTEKTEVINGLNEFFSARQFELLDKASAAAAQLTEARYRYNKLEEQYGELYAAKLVSEADGSVIKLFENMEKGFITSVTRALAANNSRNPSFIFNRTADSLTWTAVGAELSGFDFNTFKTGFLPLIDGRGGGKPPLWQGIANKPDGIKELINKLKQKYLI